MTNDVFPKSEDMGARTWGNEILLALVPGKYTVKRLEVRAGEKGGLQYHHLKDEVGVMISGEMIVRIDDGSGKLIERIVGPGDVIHFAPGLVLVKLLKKDRRCNRYLLYFFHLISIMDFYSQTIVN